MKIFRTCDIKKILHNIIGKKVEGRISKRVFQENKALQISEKEKFLPPAWYAHVRTCAYQGVKNVCLSENFLETPVLRFALLTYYQRY